MKKNHSEEFKELWEQNLFNRGVLIVVMVVRFVLASLVIAYILNYLSPFATWVHVGIAMIIMLLIVASRRIKLISIRIERTFLLICVRGKFWLKNKELPCLGMRVCYKPRICI